jgi:hypothetical protein
MDSKPRWPPVQWRFLAVLAALCLISCEQRSCADSNVVTQHNDRARTGAYLHEKTLTPKAVAARGMRVKFWLYPCFGFVPALPPGPMTGCIDSVIDSQPLYVEGVRRHVVFFWLTNDMVFVSTIANTVYGVDADTGDIIWTTGLVSNDGGRTPIPRGIRATPVIDATNNRMYVLYGTKNQWPDQPLCQDLKNDATREAANAQRRTLRAEYWLAVLDIRDGTLVQPVQHIDATVLRRDRALVSFVGANQFDHVGLLLDHGSVYIAFGAPAWAEGCTDYHGWVMRYDASTLKQRGVFNTSVDSTATDDETYRYGGAGIWQGGGGLAADLNGNVYFTTGNGIAAPTMGPSSNPSYRGDAIVKLTPTDSGFSATTFFPDEAQLLQDHDGDLGSGGVLLLPDTSLVMGGGKSGFTYVLRRTDLGFVQKLTTATNQYNNALRGETWNEGPHLHGALTYWRDRNPRYGNLYVWGEKDVLRRYPFDLKTNRFDLPPIQGKIEGQADTMPGGMISLSADGDLNGSAIVWATLPLSANPTPHPAALYAYEARDLVLLWSSPYGVLSHWVPPTIADGTVFVAEGGEGGLNQQMLIAYELGSADGSDRPNGPVAPRNPDSCQSCHHSGDLREALNRPMDMRAHYENGASIPALPVIRLAELRPPGDLQKVAVFEGNGMRVYEAQLRAGSRDRLEWVAKEDTADLVEIRSVRDAMQKRPPRHVKLSGNGLRSSASDGGSAETSVVQTAKAPQDDEDWALYRVDRSSGSGALNGVTYIQRVHTHAGIAPRYAPQKMGEVAQVPHYAQYWCYSPHRRE